MGWDGYYEMVRKTYDAIADTYDARTGRTQVSRRAKDLAVETIASLSPPGGRLLDIGCYTGGESLRLAGLGFHVLGVDLSPRMVALSRNKAKRWHLEDRATFEVARASDLSPLKRDGLAPFDVAYSVYGTLNLEPQIDAFKATLLPLLKGQGSLVVGLLNPTVLYQLLLGPFKFQFDGYRKLGKKGVKACVGDSEVRLDAHLYSSREFAELLAPEFIFQRSMGVHWMYPPPGSTGEHERGFWKAARAFDSVERRVQGIRPFADLGLFSLSVFQLA